MVAFDEEIINQKGTINDLIGKSEKLEKAEKRDFIELKKAIYAIYKNQINITCTGLYNHGKSTLLNTLINDFEYKTFKIADARETTINQSIIHNDIEYIDTPGLNAKEKDDKQVMEAIQNSDINLFVHAITAGEFNKKEIEFLDNIKKYWKNPKEFIERTIFVLSRIDNISNSEDIERASNRIKEQIKDIFYSDCLIIAVSSTDYVDGMLDNEDELIYESNIEKLKEQIKLKSEKSVAKIKMTKIERFEKQYSKLYQKLNSKLKLNQTKIKQLQEEKKRKDLELKNDISKIENTLKSMYSRIE